MPRDKRAKFYTMPDLPREQYEENERLIRECGLPYNPPKVKLVKPDTTTFHPWPCACHPNIVKKETEPCTANSKP